ncbi:MAG: hypothetical protein ACP5NK_05135 [Thermoplasmata archaeon]
MVTEKKKNETDEDDETEEKRTVSIKGVSDRIYRKMTQIAKDTGKTIGEITNESYKTFLGAVEGAVGISKEFVKGAKSAKVEVVSNFKNLEITGKELLEIGNRVSFRNIDNLTISDISEEDFNSHIDSFIQIRNLVIPENVRKSIAVKKCNFVDNLSVLSEKTKK